MIKPTIFIGLGTTGANILKQLRQLMAEEFGYSGLPIFRYIAIETRPDETGNNLRHFKDYEQIHVVTATIESTNPVKLKLDPYHQNYNPHLKAWITTDLLNHIQSFVDGASNIRMAGRLCLWENWEEIENTLYKAFNAAISTNTQRTTMEILRQHYGAKNQLIPDEIVDLNGINVYVFGSLCGGTCSGMMIDMAYYLRSLLGGGPTNNIYGLFTMYDRLLAESTDVVNSVRAANCYASLLELNYYNHIDTVYDVTFPNNRRVNTRQMPYDYALVVSPTGKLPNIRFISEYTVDENGLNLMVALNLFAETAGDIWADKAAMHTDWKSYEGYGTLKPAPAGEISTMTRCLASFGLTAVWYPKYRIARAAACFVSRELCGDLKGTQITSAEIKADASNEWHRILGNVGILTSSQVAGQPSLIDEIRSLLDIASKTFNREISSEELMQEMNEYPGGEIGTFSNMFAEGGKYFDWMKSKLDECKRVFLSSIDQLLDNQLVKVDFDGTYGLGDVRVFFEELNLIIEQVIQQYSSEIPQLDLSELDFEPMRRAENNIWTKIAGIQKKAVRSHREKLIEEYRRLIDGKESIYQKTRNYFLRQILLEVQAKLGFRMPSDGPTIKQQLEQIQSNLNDCIQTLNEEYHEYIRPPRYECVKIVANSPQNSVQTEAEFLSDQIVNDITSVGLLVENGNPITMATFLKKGHEDLRLQMTETLRRVALDKINNGIANGTAVTKVQEILNTDGEDIRDLARRSNPYIEFSPMYEPLALDCRTKIVLGHDSTRQSLENLKDAVVFDRTGNSSVDHFLFFYQEEAGFAPDDLAAYELLKHHFERIPGIYGHLTHQDPNFFDITSRLEA